MRVFLGLDLPQNLRAALEMQQFLLPLARRVTPENLHLTLVFCDEIGDAALDALHDELSGLSTTPFALTLAGFGLFGGAKPHSAWAGIAPSPELTDLQHRAETAARRAGLSLPHRRFAPHVTLGRFPRPDPAVQMRLERAIAAGSGFTAGPWRVEDMVLWRSDLGGAAPRYSELARYPFAADAAAGGARLS